ncbi:uncharacterized protein LOC111202930 isoform X1 [Brassica napus]|uniref:uncharacterized protein LOC111202930 isoform X1 n=1 Tax=Brassica napus TaxID=3708 RepID=UPI000BBE52C7|nr:uncharacterized protein LOC111202930 isoform X1 [Brassica napus]XP_048603630.1 uncharacterized protein LOC111202930 isoform X1 [Brassica napus]
MRTDHHVHISYWKAWKSRELALESGLGNTADAYKMLPSYLSRLALANPGTVAAIETTPDEGDLKRFKYMFLPFGASAKGYGCMRKVVVVDGTHLKGKYNGCLLTTSAHDANYQIFPIAFGIVDNENDQLWSWFFQKLTDVVLYGYDLVFVSDIHNSIYAGLHKVYPMAKHYACVVSMFKKKHLAYLVSKAARAYRVCDFYKHFNEIKMIDINCADYLIRIGLEHWARSHSSGMRYNIMTSNVAESLNAALSEAMEYPIVALVEYIRGMLMRWFLVRRESSDMCGGLVTPKVDELISRNFNVSTGYLVRHISKVEYEVRGKERVLFCVDLDAKTCSCLEFYMLCIPCGHAVAAAIHSKRRVDVLVGEELSRNNWTGGYSMSVNPAGVDMGTTPEDDTLASLILAPPNTRRPPGRPKKTRILSRGEFKVSIVHGDILHIALF